MKSRKISTLEEKETYKYFVILEAGTIKHAERKEKFKKNTLREQKDNSKPNYIAEI